MAMSCTITVPAAVPSLFQSSSPLMPSLAVKHNTPFMTVKLAEEKFIELPNPTKMSLTISVPAAEPSDFHNSYPFMLLFAIKYSTPFKLASWLGKGKLLAAPAFISFTISVPAEVPSLFQSSTPFVPLSALKNNTPFTACKNWLGPPQLEFTPG